MAAHKHHHKEEEAKKHHEQKKKSSFSIAKISLLLLAVSTALYIGASFAFDTMFIIDEARNFCAFKLDGTVDQQPDNYDNPAHFFGSVYTCPLLRHITFHKYFFPKSAVEVVNFTSRDPEWIAKGGGKLQGYLFLQPNNTEAHPFAIGVHGFRSCKREFPATVMSNILWKAGYNVLSIDMRNHGESDYISHAPYATFGSEEHKDILGALDYLASRFPNTLASNHSKVGLFGCSMGGATILISLAKDPRLKAAWADSPACDVMGTYHFGATRFTGHSLAASAALSLAASIAKHKSPHGFPPFDADPMELVKGFDDSKHVFFIHGTQDIIVPIESSYKCIDTINKHSSAGKNVETYFNATYFDPLPKRYVKEGSCDGHCHMMLAHPELYAKQLVNFFDKVLK